jgi:hypothetical protein
MRIRALVFSVSLLAVVFGAVCENVGGEPKLISVKKFSDRGEHNAFTDLVRFKDRWYCVFREGKDHVSPDGAVRILTSDDGDEWDSAGVLSMPAADLRDPKLAIAPDGKLMLSAASVRQTKEGKLHQTMAWRSTDGKDWNEAAEIGEPNFWLWRVTWHKDKAYGIGYGTRGDNQFVRLYQSRDGRKFETLVPSLYAEGYPNESSLLFLDDDTCYCLLRRDGQPNSGLLGIAKPPYTEWKWKNLGQRIGGPHMMRLPDGRIVAAVRLIEGGVRTSLCLLDPEKGTLDEFLKLPSGGDTSYAGLAWHDELLWVSYYSSHDGKTSIYVAKVRCN